MPRTTLPSSGNVDPVLALQIKEWFKIVKAGYDRMFVAVVGEDILWTEEGTSSPMVQGLLPGGISCGSAPKMKPSRQSKLKRAGRANPGVRVVPKMKP